LAKAEQGSSSAKLAPGLVIESVHLMGARGYQPESGCLKAAGEGANIINSELDLDFTVRRHAASIKNKVTLVVGPERPKKGRMAASKCLFGNFFQK